MRVTGWAMHARGEPLRPIVYEASPGPGQALVRVAGCGVCHTDLGFLDEGVPTRHALPLVLGHEISGRVEAAGSDAEHLVGTSVVVPAVIPCGRCLACQRGRGAICRAQVFPGNDVHGGFATHVVVPAHGLCPVDVAGDDLARLAVLADATSTAWQAVQQSGLQAGQVAVVVGVGGVGAYGVQVARTRGATVIAVDVDPDRLELALAHGAAYAVDARGKGPAEVKRAVRALVKERDLPGAEHRVFEMSGTRAGQETAFALLTFGGHLGVVGFHPGDVTVRLSNLMALDARAEGTWGCPPERFGEVVSLVREGRVVLAPFVELHPLSRVNEVLDGLRTKRLRRRPILVPDALEA